MMNLKKWTISILFNLVETICIFYVGYLLGVKLVNELIILMLFAIPRQIFNGASHYKSPLKCFIVSMLLGTSFMLMFNVNEMLGYVAALFSGCILTEKGNITNIYQWTKVSKYQSLIDYMKDNPNDETIKEYEKYMEKYYPFRYDIYNLKFKENKSLDKICEELDTYSHWQIVNELNIIYDTLNFSLKLYE